MDTHSPQPGAEHQALAQLAGNWGGKETMYPSDWTPEERTCEGTIRARVLEGFFVVSDYEQKTGDQVTFRGHGVYSWDPAKSVHVMYWFDSMGGAGGVATGKFHGNQLTFQNSSPMGLHRYRYTFDQDLMVFEMSMSPYGEVWQPVMRGEYRPV